MPLDFTTNQLIEARKLAQAGDDQLVHALEHVRNGRLAQTLAGVPELMRRYQTASPGARALLHAAVDARRLGVGLHLPLKFLEQAGEGYLTDDELDALDDRWVERGLAETGEPVHGGRAPLRRVRIRRRRPDQNASDTQGPFYRLEDYLEQHGAHKRKMVCPPLSFWEAGHEHLTDPGDLMRLSAAARNRHHLYWADQFRSKAADAGNTDAL